MKNDENILSTAKNILLNTEEIDEKIINKIITSTLINNDSSTDLYFQNKIHESWYIEDSKIKKGNFSIKQGFGMRSIIDEKINYTYCDDISLSSIKDATKIIQSVYTNKIINISKNLKKKKTHIEEIYHKTKQYYSAINPIDNISQEKKISILQIIDEEARKLDPRVIQVSASLNGCFETIIIANSNLQEKLIADIRPLVSIKIKIIVEGKNGKRETAQIGGGGRTSYSYFFQNKKAIIYAKEAVKEAITNLDSLDAPAGSMPVVLGPGWPGILLHEAIGHGLEGDFNRKKLSAFSGKIGKQIASKEITIVDNGTLKNKRGSINIDDEGTPSQCTTLIENGILKNYMQDNFNAKLMKTKSTGNCRRESYEYPPIPRMTNTYMLPGKFDPKEIIESVKYGIYATNFDGGQVDITSGQFVFSSSKAYLIKNGKISNPIKGATLIGNGIEIMNKISMIGNDLNLDYGIGTCIKDNQSVPVGVGQPTIKIDTITIGGTKNK
ncbi:metalloprotease TldD [Candidatus Legionella polyplacis]|uniref:Metalloprotease TldD n=1 Tax=Candidatus Legionella polyplacis TaxID=2005262 RepID=A0ABZ2H0K1_9GAMM